MQRLFAFVLLILAQTAPAQSAAIRDLGEMEPCPGVLGADVKAVPQAGVAVLYDRCDKRHRVLTADGRLTDLGPDYPGDVMFDRFEWEPITHQLYSYAGLTRYDPRRRRFWQLAGEDMANAKTHVPRWHAIVTVGRRGFFVTTASGLVPLPTRGMPDGFPEQLRDLPYFDALLLEMHDGSLYIRCADGRVYPIGRYADARQTVQHVAELSRADAVQVLTSRDGFHIAMRRSADGIWRPGAVSQVWLGSSSQAGVNGFIPALDAMLVRVPGWKLLDWWFGRSGFYTLGPNGLVPYGEYADRPPDSDAYPNVTTLPSTGESFLQLVRSWRGPESRFRITPTGLVFSPLPPAAAYLGTAREVPGTGQVVVTTPDALWRIGQNGTTTILTHGAWVHPWPLPLTREVAFWESGGLGLITADGRRRHIAIRLENARIVQLAPDRLFVIGNRITEVRIPQLH